MVFCAANTIFVGNLPWSVTDESLTAWFAEVGAVACVRIAEDHETGKRKGFAHVEFVDAASATKAMEYNGQELEGRALRIDISAPRPARQSFGGADAAAQSDGKTCFVKGFDTSDEDGARNALMEAFSEYGEVTEVRLPYDRENQCLKGFGYITYAEANGAPVRSYFFPSNTSCMGTSFPGYCYAVVVPLVLI